MHDGIWTWQGEHTRCHSDFSADGRVQTASQERTDGGSRWLPSMEAVLTKVE